MGWRAAAAILAKDLKLEVRRVETVATMAVFAVLVALVFVFAGDPTPADLRRLGPGALWVSLLFAGAIGFGRWFAQEERNQALQGLLVSPVDRAALFAGKWAGATIFLLGIECALVPVTLTMYQLDLARFDERAGASPRRGYDRVLGAGDVLRRGGGEDLGRRAPAADPPVSP